MSRSEELKGRLDTLAERLREELAYSLAAMLIENPRYKIKPVTTEAASKIGMALAVILSFRGWRPVGDSLTYDKVHGSDWTFRFESSVGTRVYCIPLLPEGAYVKA